MLRFRKGIGVLLAVLIIAGSLIVAPVSASAATTQTVTQEDGIIQLSRDNTTVTFSKTRGILIKNKVFLKIAKVVCDGVELKEKTDYIAEYVDQGVESGNISLYLYGKGKYGGEFQKNYSGLFRSGFFNFKWEATRNADATISETVTNGAKELTRDKDYCINYYGPSNKSTLFTYTGMGAYSGYYIDGEIRKTAPLYLTKKNTTVTFSENDGIWEPSTENVRQRLIVTIEKNGKTVYLKRNTDYIMYYYDNSKTDVYRARIIGINDYCGSFKTTAKTTHTDAAKVHFIWGKDNLNHINGNFYKQISMKTTRFKTACNTIQNSLGLSNTVLEKCKAKIRSSSGTCEGMSVLTHLCKQGYIDRNAINSIQRECSLLLHFQSFNVIFNRRNHAYTGGVKKLESLFDKYSTCALYLDAKGGWGHTVLAYGSEPCSYTSTLTNKTYDRRILICDPNYGYTGKLNDDACIYYDSTDGSWVHPAYKHYNTGVPATSNAALDYATNVSGKKTVEFYPLGKTWEKTPIVAD